MSNKQELEQIVNHISAEEVLKKHILSKNQDFDATKSCSTLLDGATAFMHPDGVLKIVLTAMQEYATLTTTQEKKEAPATGQGMGEGEEVLRLAFRAGIEATMKNLDWENGVCCVGSSEEDTYIQSLNHPTPQESGQGMKSDKEIDEATCSLKYDHHFLAGTGIDECPECGKKFKPSDKEIEELAERILFKHQPLFEEYSQTVGRREYILKAMIEMYKQKEDTP